MKRRTLIVGAVAATLAPCIPAVAGTECMSGSAVELMRDIHSDVVLDGLTPKEALTLITEYLTYCKENYPGFNYLVQADGLGYSVYMKDPDEAKFRVLRTMWGKDGVSIEEIEGEFPNG